MRERRARFPGQYLLIGVVVLYVGLLIAAPLVALVQHALSKGPAPLVTALSGPDVVHAFAVTLLLTLGAALINLVGGVLLAWVLVRHTFPGRQLWIALIDMPFVISPVIIGYVLLVLFGSGGWLQIPDVPVAFALPGMLIATVIVSMPFVVREVMPILAALGLEQEEGAYTLGASRWLTFRRIIFPEIRLAVLYGVALTVARALGEFGAVLVIGGAIQGYTESATIYIYRALNIRGSVGAYGAAILLGGLSVLLLIGMDRFRRRVEQRRGESVEGEGQYVYSVD
ncbi:MAG TPA: sulfate ABC transporter permease subunit [Aggregatilineaceae bacterium]|nr:sulfate ABC transporter permease subunit [Aggregatilineaceae bacterium]